MGTHIPAKTYKSIIRQIPIVCVDLLIRQDDKYLLVKRRDEPRKGQWWVPGGRIDFSESAVSAAVRKCNEETNLYFSMPTFVRYYEEYYKTSAFHVPCHTVSLVFTGIGIGTVKVNRESSSYKWVEVLPYDFLSGLR
jgi:colanic acid biosynthesis protein WcaH